MRHRAVELRRVMSLAPPADPAEAGVPVEASHPKQARCRVVSSDPNRSRAYARGAAALRVALALGEVKPEAVIDYERHARAAVGG